MKLLSKKKEFELCNNSYFKGYQDGYKFANIGSTQFKVQLVILGMIAGAVVMRKILEES